MSAEDNLTATQKQSISNAVDLISIKMLNDLTYGGEIELNNDFTLYHYTEEDIVTVVLTEDWTEIYQVLWDNNNITLEAL